MSETYPTECIARIDGRDVRVRLDGLLPPVAGRHLMRMPEGVERLVDTWNDLRDDLQHRVRVQVVDGEHRGEFADVDAASVRDDCGSLAEPAAEAVWFGA